MFDVGYSMVRVRLEYAKGSFYFSGVKNWNDIPGNIREQESLALFKKRFRRTFRACKTQTRPLARAAILLYVSFFFIVIVTVECMR